jgi:hypothetical protein
LAAVVVDDDEAPVVEEPDAEVELEPHAASTAAAKARKASFRKVLKKAPF